MKTYSIKPSYVSRESVPHFDDTPFKDEFQDEVYKFAAGVVPEDSGVLDVGCGSGFKLLKYFGHLSTIGFEVQPTLGYLRETYPERLWMAVGATLPGLGGLVICSDVIEHVLDPDCVLDFIASLHPERVVISTPDRVELGLGTEDGPPRNIHHVREWTHDEFVEYLSPRFDIEKTVRGKTIIVQGRPR